MKRRQPEVQNPMRRARQVNVLLGRWRSKDSFLVDLRLEINLIGCCETAASNVDAGPAIERGILDAFGIVRGRLAVPLLMLQRTGPDAFQVVILSAQAHNNK
jgi:hypothetical protein